MYLEVVHVPAKEDLGQLKRLKLVLLKVELEVELKVLVCAHLVGRGRRVVVEEGEHVEFEGVIFLSRVLDGAGR